MLLRNKIALVTGASRGIGAAVADAFAREGATVIGTATSAIGAKNISKKLLEHKGRGEVLDVTVEDAIENVIKSILSTHGSIDILVNNAGITRDALLMRMKDEDWDSVIQTNLKSVFRTSRAVLRNMIKARAGRIINITSIIGTTGNAGQTNYAASKAGIMGFTKSLAIEVGSRCITVNCIAPGFINTDMTRALSEGQREALLKNIAMARLGETEDIAQAAVFLASDHAAYITGQTLHVNGGMLMP